MSWIPLHVHSQYSILQSTASVKDLVKKAQEHNLTALALTDFCNMYGAVDFFKTAQAANIKPILGLEMMIAPTSRHEKKRNASGFFAYPITLIAKNAQGYQNLCKITSIGYTEGFYYTPRIDKEVLSQYKEGLICLSGSSKSLLAHLASQNDRTAFETELDWYLQHFQDDFYFEVQNHKMTDDKIIEHGINKESWLLQKYKALIEKQQASRQTYYEYSKAKGIPCVATNEIKYIDSEDYKAQEILMNIGAGEVCEIWERDQFGNAKNKTLNPKRQVLESHEYYFKSPEEMQLLFKEHPEAIANTHLIADKVSFAFDFKRKFYPVFIPPSLQGKEYDDQTRIDEAAKHLKTMCYSAMEERYDEESLAKIHEKYPDKDPKQVVLDRLEHELEIITSKGLCDYLLIVHDFIFWAKQNRIPVGPGRGSGVGSIILYLIGITDIEPLRFSLFFERFINPERLSYPDIDVDICMERRQEVIDYTIQKYGSDKVAQIITFGTMKAKMAIKDVGRVLNVPLTKVNTIAKLVPDDLNITIDKALEVDPDFRNMYETDKEANRLIEFARKVEGSIRNTGIHAAGIIICGDPLTDHIPVCTAKDTDILVTQYSMKPVETVGMLKIDFLGLKTLTCIQRAADMVEKHGGQKIEWSSLPLDDAPTFELLNQGKTLGIFQLESAGMRELAKQLHIDTFEEIIAVGALYRPGPMEMIPSFISRKHGKEEIEIDHPLMADILKETNGIIVYQEQVMQIAQLLANYSLGEGDVLRRAMGKKDKEEMARQGEKFKEGAKQKGIPEETAMMIFNKVEKFASYGFNKSHATAYAYLSYVTSYLKANHTKEWMASLMTCDLDDLTKVTKHIRESQALEIPILSPDINESFSEFVPTKAGIRFSLAAIKGIGEGLVESIIAVREESGPFKNLQDFIERIDSKKVGKKAIENLIDAGCFDFLDDSRQYLKRFLENFHDAILKKQKEKQKGILDLFAATENKELDFYIDPQDLPTENTLERLKKEKELLGFYVTGHPLNEFKELVQQLECVCFEEISQLPNQSVIPAAFILDSVQVRLSNKTQKKFAIITISDGMERFELPVWPDIFSDKAHLFEENHLLFGIFIVDQTEGYPKLSMRFIEDLPTMDEEKIKLAKESLSQVKKQVKNAPKRAKMKEKEEVPIKAPVKIILDIEQVRLSHILQLKKIFHDYSGLYPIQLDFHLNKKSVSKVVIDHHWGISYTTEFQKTLEGLPFCLGVSLTK